LTIYRKSVKTMPRVIKRFKIELNSADNLRDLLQEVIELADEQLTQIQDEINKLKNSTDLTQEVMDGKAKYAKAINDYLGIKDKAMAKKIDVAKMLNEVMQHNGDVKAAMEENNKGGFNINTLQAMIDDTMTQKSKSNETKTITLKKP
jgi:ribosomal protein S13